MSVCLQVEGRLLKSLLKKVMIMKWQRTSREATTRRIVALLMWLLFGLALLAVCDELWCFTVNGEISVGMENEVAEAKRLRIPIRYFDMAEVRT